MSEDRDRGPAAMARFYASTHEDTEPTQVPDLLARARAEVFMLENAQFLGDWRRRPDCRPLMSDAVAMLAMSAATWWTAPLAELNALAPRDLALEGRQGEARDLLRQPPVVPLADAWDGRQAFPLSSYDCLMLMRGHAVRPERSITPGEAARLHGRPTMHAGYLSLPRAV